MAAGPWNTVSRRAFTWQHPQVIKLQSGDKLETRDPAGAGERHRQAACPAAGPLAGPSRALLGPRCRAGGGLRGFVADRGAKLSASMSRKAPARYSYATNGLTTHEFQELGTSSMPADSALPAPMSRSSRFAFDSIVQPRPRTARAPSRVALAATRSCATSVPAMPLTRFTAD